MEVFVDLETEEFINLIFCFFFWRDGGGNCLDIWLDRIPNMVI